jgi:hypothetical protein
VAVTAGLVLSSLVAPTGASAATSTFEPVADTSVQPDFPIRAAFYYPWFPEGWDQNGIEPFSDHQPSLGFYDSAEDATRDAHVRAFDHAEIDAGIYSWWGQGSKEDIRFPDMLTRTTAIGSPLRWAVYHEPEGYGDPSVAELASDLDHIRSRYASDPAYLEVEGRPVVFVYANAADGCGMVSRWHEANEARDFYVVLKVFEGYVACADQPDSWHQYAPPLRVDHQPSFSYSISPGFDLTGPAPGQLPRDLAAFREAVRAMVASGEPWQLITTFNEWGENSAVESAEEWSSPSGFGQYLDALRDDGE